MSKHETPVFIVISGVKGAGKTSVAHIIGARLRDLGMDVNIADDNGQTILQPDMLQGDLVLEQHSPIFITTSDRKNTGVPI